jgi:hypothetical protein
VARKKRISEESKIDGIKKRRKMGFHGNGFLIIFG